MSRVRIALANIRVPATPSESVLLATSAIVEASRQGAMVICFPECFVPGYRWPGTTAPAPDPAFLERAWVDVAEAARAAHITVILGTERVTERGLQITVCVINPDGTVAGWQDKGQLDPSEEAIYPAFATERMVVHRGVCSSNPRTRANPAKSLSVVRMASFRRMLTAQIKKSVFEP